jgi:hypothetical protein
MPDGYEPRMTSKQVPPAVGELLICPCCMVQWVGAAFLLGLCAAPRTPRCASNFFAVRTVAEVANFAQDTAVAEADRREDAATCVHRREAAA